LRNRLRGSPALAFGAIRCPPIARFSTRSKRSGRRIARHTQGGWIHADVHLPRGLHRGTFQRRTFHNRGSPTSIAAFIGWAPQGPTDQATLIQSWADYQALFGGLDARSKLGYSVNQFFANGGTQAYIVRLVWAISLVAAPGTNPTPSATAVAAGVGYATAAISVSVGAIVSPPIPLSVGTPVLQSLSIGPANLPPIPLGATVPLAATGKSSDGPPLSWQAQPGSPAIPAYWLSMSVPEAP
jgi:hypothetical protein